VRVRTLLLLLVFLGAAAYAGEPTKPLVVFVAGEASHQYGTHEFNAGGELLVAALNRPESPVRARLYRDGWPKQGLDLSEAASLVLYMDGGDAHPVIPHLDEVDGFVRRGGGIMAMHYAIEVPTGAPAAAFLRWIGGYYESGYSTNPTWRAALELDAAHPVARGVRPLTAFDEWYFSLRLRTDMEGITPLAQAVPDEEARANPTWPRTPAPHVISESGQTETLIWGIEREDGGRGLGFSGGHFHWNWGNDAFRRLVLNAIVWTAVAEVPEAGMESARPDLADLEDGQDEGRPWFFYDPDEIRERFELR
jgi:hypothetical protein